MVNILKKVFSLTSLVGDLRSAAIGSVFGVLTSIFATWLFANPIREYAVHVSEDGYGQPRGLFDFAEQQDSELQLSFKPQGLRNVFVCEYKLVTAENWRRLVLTYLDAYRDCFDVSAKSASAFTISPNMRSTILKKNDDTYLCKCGS